MRYLTHCLQLLLLMLGMCAAHAQNTRTFAATDGLTITADWYGPHQDSSTPVIVLFHQAGWSRGEYLEIAPRLNALGFNCLAVDQRSGKTVNAVDNETAQRARQAGKKTTYIDALPDIAAALVYARAHLTDGKVIAWGSSYSAALVLKIAGDQPALADGVLAFAPGEYFSRLGKTAVWIQTAAKQIKIPAFITSAQSERGRWSAIFTAIPSPDKASYLPTTRGNHGSRALWRRFSDSPGYWAAVTAFLQQHFL